MVFRSDLKLLKRLSYSPFFTGPQSPAPPHLLDEEIRLAVAKPYDFVNTRPQLALRRLQQSQQS